MILLSLHRGAVSTKKIKEPKVKIKKAEVLDFGLDDEEADETPELKFDL